MIGAVIALTPDATNPNADTDDPLRAGPANDTQKVAPSQPTPVNVDFVLASLVMLQQATASHPVPEAVRGFYVAQITDTAAARAGKQYTTADVLADVTESVPRVTGAVMAGQVRGFGPYEMRYTIDLATELADRWTTHRQHDSAQATASAVKSVGRDDLSARRAELYELVASVTTEDSPDRAALERNACVKGPRRRSPSPRSSRSPGRRASSSNEARASPRSGCTSRTRASPRRRSTPRWHPSRAR